MTYPIYIPSKRNPKAKIFQMLDESNLEYNVVVQPDDYSTYARFGKNLLIVPEDDKNHAYYRNFILDEAIKNNQSWVYIINDKLKKFYRCFDKKATEIPAGEALNAFEFIVKRYPDISHASMEIKRFAFRQLKTYKFNVLCQNIVLINVKKVIENNVKYKENFYPKDEIDFSLQFLSKNLDNIRTNLIAYDIQEKDEYESASPIDMMEAVGNFYNLWGDEICDLIIKNHIGLPDVKINWEYFKSTRKI